MTLQEALKVSGNIKLRRQIWPLSQDYLIIRNNCFYTSKTDAVYSMTYGDAIADDWLVMSCKHEPILHRTMEDVLSDLTGVKDIPERGPSFKHHCKHCGVKIRAEKWVDV